MEVSTGQSRTVTNSTSYSEFNVSMHGQKLEDLTNFELVRATLSKNGTCSGEIRQDHLSNGSDGRIKQTSEATPSDSQASSSCTSLSSSSSFSMAAR